MASQAQIKANRGNAKKSTGPRTKEGKAKSSRNATTHGFTTAVYIIPIEEKEEFDALLASLLYEFQPVGTHEQILVEKMATGQWASLRAIRFQGIILGSCCRTAVLNRDFAHFLRYQTVADRAYRNAHTDLVKAQKERLSGKNGFVSSKDSEPFPPPPEVTPKPAPDPSELPEIIDFEREVHKIAHMPPDEFAEFAEMGEFPETA